MTTTLTHKQYFTRLGGKARADQLQDIYRSYGNVWDEETPTAATDFVHEANKAGFTRQDLAVFFNSTITGG